MTKEDGGSAFPADWDEIRYTMVGCPSTTTRCHTNGMSLRDWFAGMTLTNYSNMQIEDTSHTARDCYFLADAMLKEREILRKALPNE